MENKTLNIIKWIARITGGILFTFGLLFYFGYGNPMPFINPEYSWIENAWLILFPIVFIGLIIGLKCEKTGGYLVVISMLIAFILGVVANANFPSMMLVALIPGFLYLIVGYNSKKQNFL